MVNSRIPTRQTINNYTVTSENMTGISKSKKKCDYIFCDKFDDKSNHAMSIGLVDFVHIK